MDEPKRSISISFCGLGEGGGRLSQAGGETSFAINTTKTDLDGLNILESHKLLLDTGGTGKDPQLIRSEFSKSISMQKKLNEFISKNFTGAELVLLLVGGGGGSGSGLSIPVIKTFIDLGIPIGCIYTLPESFCEMQTHLNALKYFQEIYSQFAVSGQLSPCILVDNDIVRRRFNVSIDKAYEAINKFTLGTIEIFNTFSTKPSRLVSAIDKQDLFRLLSAGGCCTAQSIIIDDLSHKQSVLEGFSNDLFVNAYDFSTAKAGGIMIIASDKVFSDPKSSDFINYTFDKFREALDEPSLIFRGVYTGRADNRIEIRSLVNGLSFPKARFDDLFERTRQGMNRALRKQNRLDSIGYNLDSADSLDMTSHSQQRRARTLSGQTPQPEPQRKKEKRKPCYNCLLDPENNSGTGKFNDQTGDQPFDGMCPVCRNAGFVSVD